MARSEMAQKYPKRKENDMAATPKPLRSRMKKMAHESRERGKELKKSKPGIYKVAEKSVVKQQKKEGQRKRAVNFARSQY